jgi:hypothetical protein
MPRDKSDPRGKNGNAQDPLREEWRARFFFKISAMQRTMSSI